MKLSSRILIAFAVIILLSIAEAYTNYMLSQKVQENIRFLTHSEAIIRNSNKTHKAMIDMQSAFRGFLLTDDLTFLESYDHGLRNVPLFLNQQRELITGNRRQNHLLDSIAQLHAKWIDYSGSLIELRKEYSLSSGSQAAYERLFETKFKKQVGKKLNDDISKVFLDFDRSEYKLRNEHGAILIASINRTRTYSVMFLTATVFVGMLSAYYIVTFISRRIDTMVRLAENISRGKFNIVNDTRNDELTGLSKSLNIMSEKLSKNIHELENRNAELNKFAYVVSHDLKAPVRGIHNVVKWIEEDLGNEISPEMRRYLEIIPERTRRMENLINGLLDYARISQQTPAELTDINELVHDIADAIVPRHFKVHIDNLPTITTQRLKLEQVFSNLISNAVKYTQGPDPEIKVTCKEYSNFFEFSVTDNGIGIDPEFHDKIFEIFQTLREKNEKESTGIGLAIVRKIIEEERGSIKLKSKAGAGSEFIFTWKKNAA